MRTVFIAGSRSIQKLGLCITNRLDSIIENELKVIVGDANGVDESVQQYLSINGYKNVEVFHISEICRNNVGNWLTQGVQCRTSQRRNFAYFSTKDKAMANRADYGLMIWDGVSRGTLRNIMDLINQSKPVALYLSFEGIFHTISSLDQFRKLIPIRCSDGFEGS